MSLKTNDAKAALSASASYQNEDGSLVPVLQLDDRALWVAHYQSLEAYKMAAELGEDESAEAWVVYHHQTIAEIKRRGSLAENRVTKAFKANIVNDPKLAKVSASTYVKDEAKWAKESARLEGKADSASKGKKQSKAAKELEELRAERERMEAEMAEMKAMILQMQKSA